jgi:hypothetical protein
MADKSYIYYTGAESSHRTTNRFSGHPTAKKFYYTRNETGKYGYRANLPGEVEYWLEKVYVNVKAYDAFFENLYRIEPNQSELVPYYLGLPSIICMNVYNQINMAKHKIHFRNGGKVVWINEGDKWLIDTSMTGDELAQFEQFGIDYRERQVSQTS